VIERHLDSEPLATGTHQGSDGASTLYDPDALFKTCGVRQGKAIYNGETGSLVTSVTDTEVGSGLTWDNGDIYKIYKTSAKDSVISSIKTDKSRGWKVTKEDELNSYGWRPEDADIDKDANGRLLPKNKRPFGPGQPE
jgi:hypothetical protein